MDLTVGLTYVAEIKTPAGVYNRFYKVVREERKKSYAVALNYKPYNKLSKTEFEVKPGKDSVGPELKIQSDSLGRYVEFEGKKTGIKKTYFTELYCPSKQYINVFDPKKLN